MQIEQTLGPSSAGSVEVPLKDLVKARAKAAVCERAFSTKIGGVCDGRGGCTAFTRSPSSERRQGLEGPCAAPARAPTIRRVGLLTERATAAALAGIAVA